MNEPTRCDEGKRLAKEYFENYKKVLARGGDWQTAFADPRVTNHTRQCVQCQNFVAWRRSSQSVVNEDGTYPSPIISGGEVLDLNPVTNGEEMPF